MTEKEFSRILRKANRTDDWLHYFFATTLLGLTIFASIINLPNWDKWWTDRFFIISFPILGLTGWIFVHWAISRQYDISIICSNEPIAEKLKIIEDYFKTLSGIKVVIAENDLIKVSYPLHWKNYSWLNYYFWIHLTIHFDSSKILINTRGVSIKTKLNVGHAIKKARLKAVNFIEMRLN